MIQIKNLELTGDELTFAARVVIDSADPVVSTKKHIFWNVLLKIRQLWLDFERVVDVEASYLLEFFAF